MCLYVTQAPLDGATGACVIFLNQIYIFQIIIAFVALLKFSSFFTSPAALAPQTIHN